MKQKKITDKKSKFLKLQILNFVLSMILFINCSNQNGMKNIAGDDNSIVNYLIQRLASTDEDGQRGYGYTPMDSADYESIVKSNIITRDGSIPSQYNAKTLGYVTDSRFQGNCGSCWAFALVAAMESKMIRNFPQHFNKTNLSLSEQQLVSWNPGFFAQGCCGGNFLAINLWRKPYSGFLSSLAQNNGPISGNCFLYADRITDCEDSPRTIPFSATANCAQLPFRVNDAYGINSNEINSIKSSIYNDGPATMAFHVFSDFDNDSHTGWWDTAPRSSDPNTQVVFTAQIAGYSFLANHMVLIIGWDDAKSAFLCKNSWGAGGPNRDGTFWFSYSNFPSGFARAFGSFAFEVHNFTIEMIPCDPRPCVNNTCVFCSANACNH